MRNLLLIILTVNCLKISTQVTYFQDIAPILTENCTSCHQDSDIGPMPLTSYDQVASYASMIKFVTNTELMPPFIADVQKVHYKNERSISDEDKKTIASWIANGIPRGDSLFNDKPVAGSAVEYDTTICMSERFEHYGIYYDQYQVFPLPIELSKGKVIKDIRFKPGNREIVRSANISLATKGSSLKMDQWDPRYGYYAYGSTGFTSSYPEWYSWKPHTKGLALIDQERLYLPPDSEILMHIHYGPYGEIQTDSSCIYLAYDDEPTNISTLQNVPFVHTAFLKDTFVLEANKKHRISTSFSLPVDAEIRSITPLAHLLCRSWEVFAVLPDKTSVHLLVIDDWDFHWREKYIFQNPIKLPAGSKIYATAIYDNTKENPYNPADSPTTMRKGPHMFDENFICYFEFESKQIENSFIDKPFVTSEKELSSIKFHINKEGDYIIVAHSLDDLGKTKIASQNFTQGTHRIRSSKLSKLKGRYVISLIRNSEVLDTWWLTIF